MLYMTNRRTGISVDPPVFTLPGQESFRAPPRRTAAISAMASVMSAVAGTGIHIFTGPVTVPAAVVIPAIVMAIMGVPSCLCTILYGAYRTAGILRDRATATAMPMSMGRCRKRGQSRHQHPGCHSSHKLFISHGMSPPFF